MIFKRICLLLLVSAVFFTCYFIMQNKYDPLARYPYATSENRSIILENMDEDDIDYIVSQQIKPEQFMDFIQLDNFDAKNILYYDAAINTRNTDKQYVVNFVNTYRNHFTYENISVYLKNYTYEDLASYFNGKYPYMKEAALRLIIDPSFKYLVLGGNNIVYKYVPADLVTVNSDIIPSKSNNDNIDSIQLKSEVISPLKQMCKALENTNNIKYGGLVLTSGYVDYKSQIIYYDKAIVAHGKDEFLKYSDYPGQSESQLGYTLTLSLSNKSSSDVKDSEQVAWLKKNAYKYGFIIRYPEGKESDTGKEYQPLTLRYVGDKIAEKIYKDNSTLDTTKVTVDQ